MTKNVYWSLHNAPYRCSCLILITLEFSWQVFKNYSYITFHENVYGGSWEVPRGRTDRHDEANCHFSHFFNVPKTDCAGWGTWHEWGRGEVHVHLVREPAGQRPLQSTLRSFRHSSTWLDNTIICFKKQNGKHGLDSSDSGHSQVVMKTALLRESWTFWLKKMWGISWLGEEVFAS